MATTALQHSRRGEGPGSGAGLLMSWSAAMPAGLGLIATGPLATPSQLLAGLAAVSRISSSRSASIIGRSAASAPAAQGKGSGSDQYLPRLPASWPGLLLPAVPGSAPAPASAVASAAAALSRQVGQSPRERRRCLRVGLVKEGKAQLRSPEHASRGGLILKQPSGTYVVVSTTCLSVQSGQTAPPGLSSSLRFMHASTAWQPVEGARSILRAAWAGHIYLDHQMAAVYRMPNTLDCWHSSDSSVHAKLGTCPY
jgi:hypothetical protein